LFRAALGTAILMIRMIMLARAIGMISLALGTSFLLAAGGAIFACPALAAVACPTCYGFETQGRNVFVERSMSLEQRVHAEQVVNQARYQVTRFYGNLTRDPRIFFCATQDCYSRIGGGGSRGMALLDFALFLSPRGSTR
jgi:hypothetical protein